MNLFEDEPLAAVSAEDAMAMGQLTEADFVDDISPPGLIGNFAKSHGCGAAGCTSGWMKLWRKRRPLFEEQWGCSTKCLELMVRAAVAREAGDGAAVGEGMDLTTPHQRRIPLGLVLLAQGWITHPQLQAALTAQRLSGRGRIGDWLTQSCGLAEDRITRGLGVQWGCPVLNTDDFCAAEMALAMPKRFVAEFGLVPLRVSGETMMQAAFAEGKDAAVTEALKQMSGLNIETGLLTAKDFALVQGAVLAAEGVPVQMSLIDDSEVLTSSILELIQQTQVQASRLVRVSQYYWLRLWLEGGRSSAGRLPCDPQGVQDHVFMVGRGRESVSN